MDTRNFTLIFPDISLCSTTSVLVTEIWEERRGKCKITCSITSHDLHCYCKGWLNNLSALIYSYNNHKIIAQNWKEKTLGKSQCPSYFLNNTKYMQNMNSLSSKNIGHHKKCANKKLKAGVRTVAHTMFFRETFYGWVDFLLFPLVHCYWHIQQCCCHVLFSFLKGDWQCCWLCG